MGGYGFLRFSIPILPDASTTLAPLVFGLSIVAVIYTSLVALAQTDMKKLIAYSSVAHMGFVTAGTFALNRQGLEGAMFQMLSHGIVSGALFLCVGVVYDRLHSREIARYGGLVNNMPRYAFAFMIFMLASVGLPGTSGFIGEFLVMVGVFHATTWVAFLITTGIILGAAYMLWLYRRVIFGKLEKDDVKAMLDLSPREVAIFLPLILIVLWMGIYPASFTSITGPTIDQLISNYQVAVGPTQPSSIIAPAEAAPTETAPAEPGTQPAPAAPAEGQ
jgi:NADH-quinone oxidoreductase subunit M